MKLTLDLLSRSCASSQHALHHVTFPFQTAPPRKADDPLEFGLDQRGGMMLFEAGKWAEIVKSLETGCV